MQVLVTGGAGFIGSHVVDALVSEGHRVRVLDILSDAAHAGRPTYLRDDVDYVEADLLTVADRPRVVAGADAVAHLASRVGLGKDVLDAPDYVRDNDLGTAVFLRALAEADGTGRIVLASSMVVYGEGRYRAPDGRLVRPGPRRPEDLDAGRFEARDPQTGQDLTPEAVGEDAPVDPRNTYAATKLHQEHLCRAFGIERGVPVTMLRYHNVYGPRMPRDTPYAGVASIIRSAYEAGRAAQVFEDGRQLRDFVHVSDVADATVRALLVDPPVDGAVNVASGDPRTVLDMARALRLAFGDGAPAPEVTGRWSAGDVRHVFADPRRAQRELGFTARVAFADGMAQFATAPLRASLVAEQRR
ncbi:MAG TPA: NAD-dependent epimerase/dehydratase family protein [Euzebyales bacterium]|nr:NAD-dependent epimerase/dehydratase family protein [Euzebyales bacterium]